MQTLEIFEHISLDRPGAAERLLKGLLTGVERLAEFPEKGQVWGDGQRMDLRQIIYGSHRIVYRVSKDELAVLSVRHTRMRLVLSPEDLGHV
jgi:plasmid stabilization system protein ParE